MCVEQEVSFVRKGEEQQRHLNKTWLFLGWGVFSTGRSVHAVHLQGSRRPILKMLKIFEGVRCISPVMPVRDLLSTACPGTVRALFLSKPAQMCFVEVELSAFPVFVLHLYMLLPKICVPAPITSLDQ